MKKFTLLLIGLCFVLPSFAEEIQPSGTPTIKSGEIYCPSPYHIVDACVSIVYEHDKNNNTTTRICTEHKKMCSRDFDSSKIKSEHREVPD